MSIVVAFHDEETRCVYLASDTLGVLYESREFETGPKWIVEHPFAVGCAGDMRLQQLLVGRQRDLFQKLDKHPNATQFAANVQALLRQEGWDKSPVPGGGPPVYPFDLLLCHAEAGVFGIDGSFAVRRIRSNTLGAVGSGCEYALGYWEAAELLNGVWTHEKIKQLVEGAVAAACKYDINCGGHFYGTTLVSLADVEIEADEPRRPIQFRTPAS